MTNKITLPWANKIRARLKENCREHSKVKPWENHVNILEFIKPILDYADAEEKRIEVDLAKSPQETFDRWKREEEKEFGLLDDVEVPVEEIEEQRAEAGLE